MPNMRSCIAGAAFAAPAGVGGAIVLAQYTQLHAESSVSLPTVSNVIETKNGRIGFNAAGLARAEIQNK